MVYRIFNHVNRSGNGRLSLREIKRSNLVSALQQVDEEEDINKVLRYWISVLVLVILLVHGVHVITIYAEVDYLCEQ